MAGRIAIASGFSPVIQIAARHRFSSTPVNLLKFNLDVSTWS